MKDTQTIGQQVRRLRKERGLSQSQLAAGICSFQTISALETDKHLPSIEIMQKIAARLCIPLHEIMLSPNGDLTVKVQLDIIQTYLEVEQYEQALALVEQVEATEQLVEYQRRELLLAKADCLMHQEQPDAATALLLTLQRRLEQERETDDLLLARLYHALGNAYYFAGNLIYAHTHYLRALQACQRLPEQELLHAKVQYNLGLVCQCMAFHEEAAEYLSFANAYFERCADPRRLANTLFAMGLLQHARHELDQAKASLQSALQLYRSQNMVAMAHRVRSQYACYVMADHDPDAALEELMSCALEFNKCGNTVREAYTYAHITRLLLQKDQIAVAGKYVRKALRLLPQEPLPRDFRLAFVHRIYALYLLKQQKTAESIEVAFQSAEQYNAMGMESEAAASLRIAVDAYRVQGQKDEAFQLLQQVADLLSESSDLSHYRVKGILH